MGVATRASSDWMQRLVTSDWEAASIAASFKRVAVLGIKTERQADQPAFYVAQYLENAGVESGIRCPEAEEAWARAGITVVADKCLMVLHRQGAALARQAAGQGGKL
ncbi:hypothetical protein TSOC_008446 [Tetrabaena socialis]|uniref:CoA-binding domain-containing protein n=1 Tax=Tetrabaena socialis TaxID=47790 RepID=A0A2J7ZYI1_9CHLO|nr:hypothetical protein TSOC_008446 [Tetrabaena socialis]|eukprot:PNH05320.1 hypothetical protein TSOC_008446 [Tetrabaena socialis]